MYISSFSISGYRSLVNVKITNMLPVCILHGLNNTGKSNVLSALETIFRRKVLIEETKTTGGESTTHERKGSFWQGTIAHFRDNFYQGKKEDIIFSASVTFDNGEIAFLLDVLTQLSADLGNPGHHKVLILNGRIKYVDDDTAEMLLERATFNNNRHVVFEAGEDGTKQFFPKLKALDAAVRLRNFEELMNLLADSFAVLPSDRYLQTELANATSGEPLVLTPKTFKNWLFTLSLTRTGHRQFEDIKKMFAEKPFLCGEIGFSKERNEIEIMVKQSTTRLPISRLGSGYQQMLYIIASVVLHTGKMLGIEELEINLSPAAQRFVFNKLKEFVHGHSGLVTQLIITSHSEVFETRGDVRCYGVTHNGDHTAVAPWSQSVRKKFFLPAKPRNHIHK